MTLWILSWNPNDSKRSDRLRFYMRCPFFRGQSNEAAQAVDKKTLNIVYISICVCVYIYNINAFRDHLGIEASGFHASPWTMHIADIYSTEAARFTLQQLQHDQYRQLIGNIYICIRCSHAMLWVMRSLSHLRFRLQQAELRSLCGALLCPTVQHRISAEEVGCPEVCGSWNIGGTQNR